MDLDDPGRYVEVDRLRAIDRILGLPSQVRDAWSQARQLDLPSGYGGAKQVLICGMGGSAIGGDLCRSLLEGEASVPIMVVRGYDLPRFVGPESLVLLSSYSGTTEETLAACDAALAAGARILAVTTGGTLAERGAKVGFPVVQFAFPAQPREAIGYSLLLILGALTALGYTRDRSSEVEESSRVLADLAAEVGPGVAMRENICKQLAQRLHGKIVVVYGGGLMAEVARRWKGQINENAKAWAFFDQLPEVNHNSVVGYRFPAGTAANLIVVLLSCARNHPRILLREQITRDLLERVGVPTAPVAARGDSALAQVFSATYLGDFASYYLALLNEADPSEIEAINFVKGRLAAVPTPSPSGRGLG